MKYELKMKIITSICSKQLTLRNLYLDMNSWRRFMLCHMTSGMHFWPSEMPFWKITYQMVEIHTQYSPHLNIRFQLFKHQLISLKVNSVIKRYGVKRKGQYFGVYDYTHWEPSHITLNVRCHVMQLGLQLVWSGFTHRSTVLFSLSTCLTISHILD